MTPPSPVAQMLADMLKHLISGDAQTAVAALGGQPPPAHGMGGGPPQGVPMPMHGGAPPMPPHGVGGPPGGPPHGSPPHKGAAKKPPAKAKPKRGAMSTLPKKK